MLGQDVVTVQYISAHGAPPIDEDALLIQLEEEEDNARDFTAAEIDESNLRKEYEVAKNGRDTIGVVPRPENLRPKRTMVHNENIQRSAEKRRKMKEKASAS